MPWTKSVNKTAKPSNEETGINFRVADGYLMVDVGIEVDGQVHRDVATMTITGPNQDSGLSGAERSSLVALLIKLRDEALTRLGYTNI